jgi:hypothetical protein
MVGGIPWGLRFFRLVSQAASPPHLSSGERPAPGVPLQWETVKRTDLEGSGPTGGDATPARGGPVYVEVDAADVPPRVDGRDMDEAIPQPRDAPSGEAPVAGPSWGPSFHPPEDVALIAVVTAPGSLDIVDFGADEVGMPCYPRASPPYTG